MAVRVRYAPSPTGHLHLGSLRTALYNWLFARHYDGTFLVRIEDTDVQRSQPEYTASILASLHWASLDPDEAPVVQSEHIQIHKEAAQQLLDEGKAYKCFCTSDELSRRLGTSAAHEGSYTHYDEYCRDKVVPADYENVPYVIRFKVPHERHVIEFTDLIRGPISFNRDQLDDFILVRSDGKPTYNFVVVVDDAFMKISHVLRGEDHISNTPRQLLLYESLGYTLPEFAHFSLILGSDGHRLSKRHMATSVEEFRKNGFLADALCNYLVRLGWSHGDQELFTRQELIEFFSLDSMSKSGAIFDLQKLEWMNGIYIRQLSNKEILTFIEQDVDSEYRTYFSEWSSMVLEAMVGLYKERVKTLKELLNELRLVHDRPREFPLDTLAGDYKTTSDYLASVRDALMSAEDHSYESVNRILKQVCVDHGISYKQVAQPLRIALIGKTSSPGVAHLISLLSVEESIYRIERFMKHMERSMKH